MSTTDLDTFLADKAASIRAHGKQAVDSIIAIGRDLIEVKARLPHGRFLPWIEREFAWKEDVAQRMMNAARAFGGNTADQRYLTDANISAQTLYALAAPSVPETARQGALDAAKAGTPLTSATVAAAAQAVRTAPPATPPAAARTIASNAARAAAATRPARQASAPPPVTPVVAPSPPPQPTEDTAVVTLSPLMTRERLDQIVKAANMEPEGVTGLRAMLDATLAGKPFSAADFAAASGMHERTCSTWLRHFRLIVHAFNTVPAVPEKPPQEWLALPKVEQFDRIVAAQRKEDERAFAARVEEAARAKAQVHIDSINALHEKVLRERDEAVAQVAAVRGRIPVDMFRFLLLATHPDKFNGTGREAVATEVFQYLRKHQEVLAMTREEEEEKLRDMERLRKFQEAQKARETARVLQAQQEAARRQAAAERRKARSEGKDTGVH